MHKKYLNFVIFALAILMFQNTSVADTDTKAMLLAHKTPTCGCCKEWVKHANNNGFKVHTQDHQNLEDIKKMYIDAGNENNALVIPVGIAFENAYKVKPGIELHKPFDGSHPSLLGTYLASCVVFASITQRSPVGIKYNYFDKISNSDKIFLQKIARATVEEFFDIKL